MNLNTLKLTLIVLTALSILSCTKEEVNLNNLNETLIIRHKKADMPAYIHGNASEKVFLIVLHGGPGGNGLQYRINTIQGEIEKNNAVVYFDQRGSGTSQGSYSKNDVSIDVMAEDILALAKVIRSKYGEDSKLFLMGHSWGGTLGPAALLKDQSEFSGWIDVDGAHSWKSYNKVKNALLAKANEQIASGNSIDYWKGLISTVNNTASSFNEDDFFVLNKQSHALEKTLSKDKVIHESKSDYDGVYLSLLDFWNTLNVLSVLRKKGLFEFDYTDRLKEITIPSLVLWGKHDVIVPFTYAQEAYDKLGSSEKEIFVFEKSAHSPMSTEPELFSQKVISFINKHK